MYIDLINELSDLDKKRIENYINLYGVGCNFIGLDKWLQNWSHSNQRLYKLLGNQFIREFEFLYEKPRRELRDEICDDLLKMEFKQSYHKFFWDVIVPLNENDKISPSTRRAFSALTDTENFIDDRICIGLKYKKEGSKKTLQLQEGMKPIRALQKVIDYFSDEFEFEGFEEFRLKHSMILNDKIVKGKVCVSIHPLDFMTMSDNASNWQSCMSWRDDGCYHVGTIEMMNSNNVVCCYLKSKTDFDFGRGNSEEEYIWNNKKWRVLSYVTKDIIMSGKPYPYVNEDCCKFIISAIKDLAKENLNWTYSFGPEVYKDMIHINNNHRMEKNRNWILYKHTTKHNIIWDTKGMYNDMLNDTHTTYWCYRNKVSHNKIISVSGKAPCLCCGQSIIYPDLDNDYDDYNERFRNTGSAVCDECLDDFYCDCCGNKDPLKKYYRVSVRYKDGDVEDQRLCDRCYKTRIKRCPICGDPFYIVRKTGSAYYEPDTYAYFDQLNIDEIPQEDFRKQKFVEEWDHKMFQPICVCCECKEDLRPFISNLSVRSRFSRCNHQISIVEDKDLAYRLRYLTLEDPEPMVFRVKAQG